jgi:hypothetical protein
VTGQAAADSRIVPGLGVSSVGDLEVCKGKTSKEVVQYIRAAKRPLTLLFRPLEARTQDSAAAGIH